jgi:hypothetical protein
MGYLNGRQLADARFDAKCGKGWEGVKGKCVRSKQTLKSLRSPENGGGKGKNNILARAAKQVVSMTKTPQGRLGLWLIANGTFIGADALARQGSVMGVTPEKVEGVDPEKMGIGKGQVVGQGISGVAELVSDKNGNEYIKKSAHPAKPKMTAMEKAGRGMYVYSSSMEATVSAMGEKAGVPVPKVLMIPAKDGEKLGSTLQEVAKGDTAINQMRKGVLRPDFNAQLGTNTVLGYVPTGLSRANIDAMAHPDVARIMALDTFTGNRDRHANNLFCDKETDSFTGIDNGLAFETPIVTKGVTKSLQQNKDGFAFMVAIDPKKREGLKIYRDTLVKLIADNPPKKTKGKLLGYMQQETGLNIINSFYTKTNKHRTIDSNYKEAKKIVALIDEVLKPSRSSTSS